MDGVPRRSWYSFDRPWKDERLSLPWSYLVALNLGPLNWESCTLNYCPRYQCHVQGLFFNNVWLALAAIYLIKVTLILLPYKEHRHCLCVPSGLFWVVSNVLYRARYGFEHNKVWLKCQCRAAFTSIHIFLRNSITFSFFSTKNLNMKKYIWLLWKQQL